MYDDSKYYTKQQLAIGADNTGLAVVGTAAADTVLLRIPICANVAVNGTARFRSITGGTAAGPAITIGKSLAGTGAVVALGTHTFGTDADGTTAAMALTSTTFDPGDEVILSLVAGTAASTHAIIGSVPYNMNWE